MKCIHRLLLVSFLASLASTTTGLFSLLGSTSGHLAVFSVVQEKISLEEARRLMAEFRIPEPKAVPIQATKRNARALRDKRNNRFNEIHGGSLLEEGSGFRLNMRHWQSEIPELPFLESHAVVLGTVTNVQPYFSGDQSSIYTEYEVDVRTVLGKNNKELEGSSITIAREGGAIRGGPDQVFIVRVNRQGFLREGSDYVLFLREEEELKSFNLLTGYTFFRGSVIPVDTRTQRSWEAVDESVFLDLVRSKADQ